MDTKEYREAVEAAAEALAESMRWKDRAARLAEGLSAPDGAPAKGEVWRRAVEMYAEGA